MSLRRREFLASLGLATIAPTILPFSLPASPSTKAQPTPKGGFYCEQTYKFTCYSRGIVNLNKDCFSDDISVGDMIYVNPEGKLTNKLMSNSIGMVIGHNDENVTVGVDCLF